MYGLRKTRNKNRLLDQMGVVFHFKAEVPPLFWGGNPQIIGSKALFNKPLHGHPSFPPSDMNLPDVQTWAGVPRSVTGCVLRETSPQIGGFSSWFPFKT